MGSMPSGGHEAQRRQAWWPPVEGSAGRGGAADGIAEARRHLDLAVLGLRRLHDGCDGVRWVLHERVQQDLAIALQSLSELQELYEGPGAEQEMGIGLIELGGPLTAAGDW